MADYLFRPHHLLCTYCFVGEGYNDEFVQNYLNISNDLKKHPQKVIKIIPSTNLDKICSKCKFKNKSGCATETKVKNIDLRHMEVFEVNYDDEITWSEAQQIIKTKVNVDNFNYMCHDCEWFSLGICYNQLFN